MRRGEWRFILLASPSTPHIIINLPHNVPSSFGNSNQHPKEFEKLSHSITKTPDTSPYQSTSLTEYVVSISARLI